eukprot:1343956-Pleurochrysis_carterae.AAC.1
MRRMRCAKCCCALDGESWLQSFPQLVASGRGRLRFPVVIRVWPGCLHHQRIHALRARVPIPRDC